MQNRIFIRSILLFLVTSCFALAIHNSDISEEDDNESNVHNNVRAEDVNLGHRNKRAISKKPGFFRTLFQVAFEQWNDTKYTISSIRQQLNDNFLPEDAPVTEATTVSSDPNVSTTTMAYKIKRSELNRILQRNLKGIVRLLDIELQDAFKQSEKNYADFKKNASIEISKYL